MQKGPMVVSDAEMGRPAEEQNVMGCEDKESSDEG
jgi:hypothetical protein